MRKLLVLATLFLVAAVAWAAPVYNISTGTAYNNWLVGGVSAPNGFYGAPWVTAPANSDWITLAGGGPGGGTFGAGGDYTFTLDLSSLLLNGIAANLSFQVAADNSYTVSFLGVSCVGGGCTSSDPGPAAFTALSGVQTASITWTGAGTPIMQVVVNNLDTGSPNPIGLLVSGTLDANEPGVIPEPSTWMLLGIGLVLAGVARRRVHQ